MKAHASRTHINHAEKKRIKKILLAIAHYKIHATNETLH
jgi:hypothetical protein